MIALLQRVREARVEVAGEVVGAIGPGLLVLLGVEKTDDAAKAQRLAERVAGYRIFSDVEDKMNLSVRDIGGSILVVSQFTLVADTRKGMRPSFSDAAGPELGEQGYLQFVSSLSALGVAVATGRFRADMQVQLINHGPVTFKLRQ